MEGESERWTSEENDGLVPDHENPALEVEVDGARHVKDEIQTQTMDAIAQMQEAIQAAKGQALMESCAPQHKFRFRS